MIAQIRGKLILKTVSMIIIDNHGIGYEVLVPLSTYYMLPDEGGEVSLSIYTCFKQDAILLVGFYTEQEKQLFKLLIAISGIGPRLAVNVLSGINSDEFIGAIVRNDLKRLLKVPGLGKKMAERVILELRDKMSEWTAKEQIIRREDQSDGETQAETQEDAISALLNLGYKEPAAKETIERVLSSEPGVNKSLDEILKQALKLLAL